MAGTYVYKVRDRTGRLVEGSLEAQNEQLVISRLREMGYVPLSVSRKSRSPLTMELSFGKKFEPRDLVVFSRQLATMIDSGLSILRSLAILSEQTESKALGKVIADMKADIEQGLSFSQAVSRHPKTFPPLYVAMVRAGETGGVLDEGMDRLATTLEKQLELRAKIKSAMTYPIVVLGIVVLILAGMLLFVVPMFEGMYKDLHGTLPVPTRILIPVSGIVTKLSWVTALATVSGVVPFRRSVAGPAGRLRWDRLKLRLPIFGPLLRK